MLKYIGYFNGTEIPERNSMNYVGPIIYNVAILFIMMMPGVIMKKCNLSPDGFGKGISKLVLYVAQPALIFLAYLKDFDANILMNSIWVLALSVLLHIIFSIIALISFKSAPDNMRRMLRFATVFSNAAFMGIPLIGAALEPTCPGATMYASIYNITFNLFLWSLGVYICTEDRDEDGDGVTDGDVLTDYHEVRKKVSLTASIGKALLHPVTLAAALGLVFFITPLNSYVPEIVTDALTMLKNLVAPLSMVVIGLRLADMSFKGMFKDKMMYHFLILRHLILPLSAVIIIRLLSLFGVQIDYAVSLVTVILAAAPAATSATMFAEQYDCDAEYVSRLVTVSTLLSIITMPLVIMLV